MANAPIQGRQIIAGFKQASAWNTAVACGANDGVLVQGADTFKGNPELLNEDSLGILYPTMADTGAVEAGGPIKGYDRYEGLDVMIACLMGTASTPVALSATSAYKNYFKMKDDVLGLFGTFAMKIMAEKSLEYPSLKILGMKHTFTKNMPSEIEFTTRANKMESASAVNTYTTLANVTYPNDSATNRIINGSGFTVWVNDSSGAALDTTNAVKPTDGEISISRPFKFNDTANATAFIDEPVDDGVPEVTVTLNFPHMSTLEWQALLDSLANTSKKMQINFAGNTIAGAYKYARTYYFPNMKYVEPKHNPTGGGQIPFSVTMRAYGYPGTTGPTGMATAALGFELLQPCAIMVINKRTTAPLA